MSAYGMLHRSSLGVVSGLSEGPWIGAPGFYMLWWWIKIHKREHLGWGAEAFARPRKPDGQGCRDPGTQGVAPGSGW
jgi:hypothetical protein